MFSFKKKRGSSNKLAFAVIIAVLIILYLFRLVSPHEEAAYPDTIQHTGMRYVYTETVRSSPLLYKKKNPVSEEGYIVLAKRGSRALDELYIYEGFRSYRKYVLVKE